MKSLITWSKFKKKIVLQSTESKLIFAEAPFTWYTSSGWRKECLMLFLCVHKGFLYQLGKAKSSRWLHIAEPLLRSHQMCSYSGNFKHFMELKRFITVFTGVLHWPLSWTWSTQSTPPHHISMKSIFILSTHLMVSFFWLSHQYLHAFLFSPIHATCFTYLIHLELIFLTLVKTTSCEVPHHAVFSHLLKLYLFSVQIFTSETCSQTPSVYPPLMSETKLHTHTEPQ
jgi:hypothetical protein